MKQCEKEQNKRRLDLLMFHSYAINYK